MLNGKRVVLGVCGGIAAFKAAGLCSRLAQAGAVVHVVMTDAATRFVAPLTFQALSGNAVHTDTFIEQDPTVIAHIDLADKADIIVIAPATANMIAKLAHGIADDMLSTILLAATAPILLAPAMNVHMYENAAVQSNMRILAERGIQFLEPGIGQLACGYVGQGRLPEPEFIFNEIVNRLTSSRILQGRHVLITAGGTIERIDPVRYITNESSGKMGFALAEAARDCGAQVTVIAANVKQKKPDGVTTIEVESARDMYDAVMELLARMDIVIKAAAVADYRPVVAHKHKLKKNEDTMMLSLEKTEDILYEIGLRKTRQFVVGFAAETEHMMENARKKIATKKCDLLVVNDVSMEGAGFGSDTNIVSIIDQNGVVEELPLMSKRHVAERILTVIADRMAGG